MHTLLRYKSQSRYPGNLLFCFGLCQSDRPVCSTFLNARNNVFPSRLNWVSPWQNGDLKSIPSIYKNSTFGTTQRIQKTMNDSFRRINNISDSLKSRMCRNTIKYFSSWNHHHHHHYYCENVNTLRWNPLRDTIGEIYLKKKNYWKSEG